MMQLCLDLAAQGGRAVMPNPLVGAVLANSERVIASGYHQYCGGAHAEVNALIGLTKCDIPKSATLYVNLEPCSHYGRTPPCVNRILELGIKRVVIAQSDPNPKVNGQGISILRNTGIEVVVGILEQEACKLNRRFLCLHQKKRPYVILKWAQTNDGFIARKDYSSKWISCSASRALSHAWRASEQAILVGYRTALHDDPELSVRSIHGVNPLRLVIDKHLSLPKSHKLLSDGQNTIIYNEVKNFRSAACQYVKLEKSINTIAQIMRDLAQRQIVSLLVEGGCSTLNEFIESFWDEARVFVAPQLLFKTGIKAPALNLSDGLVQQYATDLLITKENFL